MWDCIGEINLTPSGGTPGYTYLWTASYGGVIPTGQSTNEDLTGLVPGTYSVKLQMLIGCISKKQEQ
jgi:hypothetical protein